MAARAATPPVEMRGSEVWLGAKQLTYDGKAKGEALLSPAGNRIAYFNECPQAEGCVPAVVILDLEGRRLQSFQPTAARVPPAQPCASIVSIVWASEDAIAAECHLNPSLDEYVETEIKTGRTRRDLLGYWFTPSPDGARVAHVGWIPHFAPPFAQSNYLQVDGVTMYPLPPGARRVDPKNAAGPPDVVHKAGAAYRGIHGFEPGFAWSADSEKIALIDCTFNWTPDAGESGRQCALVVIAMNGQAQRSRLPAEWQVHASHIKLAWTGPHEVTATRDGKSRRFAVHNR